MESQSDGLKIGDLAWGKIKGYPWWPGKVNFGELLVSLAFID